MKDTDIIVTDWRAPISSLYSSGEVEIINVKLGNLTSKYLNFEGIYTAYHLSKKNWVSIILNDTLKDEEIMNLVAISYKHSSK